MIDAFIPDPKYLHGKGIFMNGIYHREEMVILLKGSLRIAQNNSFIEDSEEQEEGLKVENADLRPILMEDWQDLIEMTMRKMDKDRDGKVSFEDYQATVSAR